MIRLRLRLRRDRVRVRLRLRRDRFRLRGTEGSARTAGRWITQVCATAAAVVIGGGSSVFACAVCFGAEETSMIDGTKLGILVLLAVTLAVQAGFVGFFLYLRRRAKHIADVDLDTEWSELQGPSRAS